MTTKIATKKPPPKKPKQLMLFKVGEPKPKEAVGVDRKTWQEIERRVERFRSSELYDSKSNKIEIPPKGRKFTIVEAMDLLNLGSWYRIGDQRISDHRLSLDRRLVVQVFEASSFKVDEGHVTIVPRVK